MLRPWRTALSVTLLLVAVWASFTIKLGRFTLAEHIDRIGQTQEAEELLEGTRSVVDPVLQEATDRMLGEYIVAPTLEDAELPQHAGPPKPSSDAPQTSRLPRSE